MDNTNKSCKEYSTKSVESEQAENESEQAENISAAAAQVDSQDKAVEVVVFADGEKGSLDTVFTERYQLKKLLLRLYKNEKHFWALCCAMIITSTPADLFEAAKRHNALVGEQNARQFLAQLRIENVNASSKEYFAERHIVLAMDFLLEKLGYLTDRRGTIYSLVFRHSWLPDKVQASLDTYKKNVAASMNDKAKKSAIDTVEVDAGSNTAAQIVKESDSQLVEVEVAEKPINVAEIPAQISTGNEGDGNPADSPYNALEPPQNDSPIESIQRDDLPPKNADFWIDEKRGLYWYKNVEGLWVTTTDKRHWDTVKFLRENPLDVTRRNDVLANEVAPAQLDESKVADASSTLDKAVATTDDNTQVAEKPLLRRTAAQIISLDKVEELVLAETIFDAMKGGNQTAFVFENLKETDFATPNHRTIFRLMNEEYLKGQVPNTATLSLALSNSRVKNEKEVDAVIKSLDQLVFTAAHLETHVANVKAESIKRQKAAINQKFQNKLDLPDANSSKILSDWQEALRQIDTAAQSKLRFVVPQDYFVQGGDFDKNAVKFREVLARKTGFENLDNAKVPIVFRTGLYMLTAQPGLGKTSFALQLGMQLAQRGEKVYIINLENNCAALMARLLCQETFRLDKRTKLTAAAIRSGAYSPATEQARKNIRAGLRNLQITDAQSVNVEELIQELTPIARASERNGDRVTIFLDYLQWLAPPADSQGDTRKDVDHNCKRLKEFCERFSNVTMICISSLARAGYYDIGIDALKESGGIEYSAEMIWALQFHNVVSRETNARAKQKEPRQIELSIVKNRDGAEEKFFFHYYTRFQFFEPATEDDFKETKRDDASTNDGANTSKRKPIMMG